MEWRGKFAEVHSKHAFIKISLSWQTGSRVAGPAYVGQENIGDKLDIRLFSIGTGPVLVTRLALDRGDSTAWLRAIRLMRSAICFTFWSCTITATAFTSSRAVVSIISSTDLFYFASLLMLVARLALDWRNSTALLRAIVLVCLAVFFTVLSHVITAIAFTSSRTVMRIVLGTAFSHFVGLSGIVGALVELSVRRRW